MAKLSWSAALQDMAAALDADTGGNSGLADLVHAAKTIDELSQAVEEWAALTPHERRHFYGDQESAIFKRVTKKAPTAARLVDRLF